MTYRLPILEDIHSSELIANCKRAAMYRKLEKVNRVMGKALFRGLMGHAAMEEVHQGNWSLLDIPNIMNRACDNTVEKAARERRVLSIPVIRDMEKNKREVGRLVAHYIERQGGYFAKCKQIGVELPVRWTLDVSGLDPMHFASHIDLLYRDEYDLIRIRDFKFQDEAPTMEYLRKNLQMFLYHFCVAEGIVKLYDTDNDDDWVFFGEQPVMEVADMTNFKPYYMKSSTEDRETGEVTKHKKGDIRPLEKIVKIWTFEPDRERIMKKELSEPVVLMRAGIWPANPDKRGCNLCESEEWCMEDDGEPNP